MPEPLIVRSATCTACGCLCDDIDLTSIDGRMISAERACALGRDWFLADHSRNDRPVATIEGHAATFDQAVTRASEILQAARSPLILGMTQTSIEAQREAVALADRIGATIDPGRSTDSLPRWLAIQRVGVVGATLGEVRDRADLVVFWGVDPVVTHPRHLERYSADPIGRFVPEGRSGRTIVVVDSTRTATAERADHFVEIDEAQGAALAALRMFVRGVDPHGFDGLRALASMMKTARYGAIFFGPALGSSANVEEMLKLVRDLNRHTRFVAMNMGSAGNLSGAENVLSWQAGSPRAIDFSEGYPRFLPDEANGESRLIRGECDAVILVADDPSSILSDEARSALKSIPTIAISPRASDRSSAIAMNTSTPGIHSGGTVLRSDGACLPLRPALTSDLPSDRDWLVAIRERLEADS